MHEAAVLAPIIGGARGVIMARDALGAVIDLMDGSTTSNQPPPPLCSALSDAESSREVVMEIRREKRHQAAPPRGEEIQHTAATETLRGNFKVVLHSKKTLLITQPTPTNATFNRGVDLTGGGAEVQPDSGPSRRQMLPGRGKQLVSHQIIFFSFLAPILAAVAPGAYLACSPRLQLLGLLRAHFSFCYEMIIASFQAGIKNRATAAARFSLK